MLLHNMKIYRHPSTSRNASDWAIWHKTFIPTSLLNRFSSSNKPYFLTKNTGRGIVVAGEYGTWTQAESAFLTLCNASSADRYLGSGRASIIALNPVTQRITNGKVVSR